MNWSLCLRRSMTAVLFLATLAAGTAWWLWGAFGPKEEEGPVPEELLSEEPREDVPAEPLPFSDAAEAAVNEALDSSRLFIQLYGGAQRLLGHRILWDVDEQYTVYKLSDGALTFLTPRADERVLQDHADAYFRFQRVLARRDIPLLYVQAPQKIGGEGAPALPPGVEDYGNANADAFLALLREGGARTLDLRQVLAQDGQSWGSHFFATDHHGTVQTGLECARALARYLDEEDLAHLDLRALDPERYDARVYQDLFLGSQGKRTGWMYAGMDDLKLLVPDFATSFTYTVQGDEFEGSFRQALLFPQRLKGDPFESNPYTVYSGGDYPFSRIINHNDPDGPRIMILRDSFGCVFTPFLGTACGDLAIVDLRYFYDDFATYIDWVDPQVVVVMYSPGNLTHDKAFDFFSEMRKDEE